jgi:hypothetical protein
MTKKYQEVHDWVLLPEGGVMQVVRIAIVEFACLGEQRFDIAGYPYASEEDAQARASQERSPRY